MPISFKPLHQHFAAKVLGFDMRQPIDTTATRTFEQAIDRYGILVKFRSARYWAQEGSKDLR
jgi:hypothetical protein